MLLRTFKRFVSHINIAVVGSGPAGFYTTQKLVSRDNIKIDIYEKLPVPFGLVRYGVAPDHPEVKNVIKSFTTTAISKRVNFYGNVSIGDSLKLEDLVEAYHAVVLCYGSSSDKLLNIDGEDSKNTISARNFVGWYNGVPEDKDLDIDLNCDTVCIVGQGNVALDCARLLSKPANLEKTDITNYAQRLITDSRIKKIYLIGRRGPVQVSFTIKELRELINLNSAGTRLEPSSIFNDYKVGLRDLMTLTRQRRRLTELLLNVSAQGDEPGDNFRGIQCKFKFMSKPHKILADENGKVKALQVQKTKYNKLEDFINESSHPDDTGEYEIIECGLVIRSIGYRPLVVDKNLPVDHGRGAIVNTNGRIQGHRSLYCSGWLATGAVGVIAGTLNSSLITAKSILEDIDTRQLPSVCSDKPGFQMISKILKMKSTQVVHFNDWLKIDDLERQSGEALGKTREKFVDVDKILEIAGGKRDNP